MDVDNFDLEEGTIEFWVKSNQFEWNNDEKVELFEASGEEGKILIFKDEKNKLKALYFFEGEKRGEASLDVSELSHQERHQVVFTWNQEEKSITLYLDGEKVAQDKIN